MSKGHKVSNQDSHCTADERVPGKINASAGQDQNHRDQSGNET